MKVHFTSVDFSVDEPNEPNSIKAVLDSITTEETACKTAIMRRAQQKGTPVPNLNDMGGAELTEMLSNPNNPYLRGNIREDFKDMIMTSYPEVFGREHIEIDFVESFAYVVV